MLHWYHQSVYKPLKDAKLKIRIKSAQSFGENVDTHFIIIVCNCGWSMPCTMSNDVRFANRNEYTVILYTTLN